MIHTLKPPLENIAYLRDIVHIQMGLLAFATSEDFVPLLEEARAKKKANTKNPFAALKQSCQAYFNDGKDTQQTLCGRGEAIAQWFWEGRSSTRHENLEAFAVACSAVREEAGKWCCQLYDEVKALLNLNCMTISIGHHFPDKNEALKKEKDQEKQNDVLLDWKECARAFLLFFIKSILAQMKE
jgi:hypothetical protein